LLAVVSHDAGGAELVSSYVRRAGIHPLYVLAGPARAVFERKLGKVSVIELPEALKQCDSILCGTSWQSELEIDAICTARKMGRRTVAFLDHWTNFAARFTRPGRSCLPDEIWVADDIALTLARQTFPGIPLAVVPNPYLLDVRDEMEHLPQRAHAHGAKLTVLFISEPLRAHGKLQFGNELHWGYSEEDALRYFLTNIAALGEPVGRLSIRPHPSEPRDKYQWVRREFDLPIVDGGKRSLVEEIAEADLVVGFESMALVVALAAGKRVVSIVPPGGTESALPHPGIQRFQDILNVKRK
jgi:hypothetical protein